MDPSDDPTALQPEDAALLAELRAATELHDPVPERALAAARAAYTWRTIDAELAELQFDSLVDAAPVRGMAWPRQLSFDTGSAGLEIEVDGDRIVGQVVPPAALTITLSRADGTTRTTDSDDIGHFTFTDVGEGTVRLSAALPDGSITTQWFSI